MVKKGRLLIFLFIFSICLPSGGFPARFEHFNTGNGLSQDFIFCVEGDDQGQVWIGTLDGLNCYDGYQFKVYKPDSYKEGCIPGNTIYKVVKGKEGKMWVVTSTNDIALFLPKGKCFVTFPIKFNDNERVLDLLPLMQAGCVPLNSVSHIAGVDQDECVACELLVRTSQRILLWNLQKGLLTTLEESPKGEQILQSPKGELWGISSTDVYSWHIDGGELKKEEIGKHAFKQFACSTEGDSILWIAGESGLQSFQCEDSLWKSHSIELQGLPQRITSLAVSKETFYIGTTDGLFQLSRRENSPLRAFRNKSQDPYSLSSNNISDLFIDSGKNLWVGTANHGINLLAKENSSFHFFTFRDRNPQGQVYDPVRAVHCTRKGELWVGFGYSGLFRYGSGFLENGIREQREMIKEHEGVRALFEDSNGIMWVGTRNGIYFFDEKKRRLINLKEKISALKKYSGTTYFINEMDHGILVFGIGNHLCSYSLESGKLTLIGGEKLSGLIKSQIRDVVRQSWGQWWIATDGSGLLSLDLAGEIRKWNHKKGDLTSLSHDKVYSLALDENEEVWVGTNWGLNKYDPQSDGFVHFFEADNLSNNIAYGLQVDDSGGLWVSTNKGLNHLETHTGKVISFLPNEVFMDDASFQDSRGRIFFGGNNGFIMFEPEKVLAHSLIPKPVITNIQVEYKDWNIPKEIPSMGTKFNGKKLGRITLPYDQNTILFGFRATPFPYPNNLKYRYRLKGFDNNWRETLGSSRQALFTNIQPGNYLFELKVFKAGFEERARELKIPVFIRPPFWERWWFRLLLLVIAVGAVITWNRWRVFQIKQRNEELKQQVDLKTEALKVKNQEVIRQKDQVLEVTRQLHEADQERLRFYTNISHEFRTPLSLILGQTELLLPLIETSKGKKLGNGIRKNGNRLLRMINQLLDLRQLEQNLMKLQVSKIEVGSFLMECLEPFDSYVEKKGLRLFKDFSQPGPLLWADPEKLEQIILNLLENSIKYTPEGGTIWIHAEEKKEAVDIVVEDTGVGIASQDLPFIFDRFFRGKKKVEQPVGNGIGLSLVKYLVDLQKGEIHAESAPGKGTRFVVSFKTGKAHFHIDELGGLKRIKPRQIQELEYQNEGNRENENTKQRSVKQGSTVLVVEDDEEMRALLHEGLKDDFNVRGASNGQEALKLLSKEEVELILCDVVMPVMDGMELCRQVKSHIATSHIPFFFLTAKDSLELKMEGFELGIDGYIEKPFNIGLLQARVHGALSNRKLMIEKILTQQEIPSLEKTLNEVDKKFLSRILELIDANMSRPDFGIVELGESLGMSRATFYRKFKSMTGQSAVDYLKKYRLNKAASLLRNEKMAVKEVVYAVGYQNVPHFRKSFKEEFGVAPSHYR